MTKSARRTVVAIVVIVLVVGFAVDQVATSGRVYAGVSVGGIDVSGMTREEASAAIEDAFAERLTGSSTVVYASEEAQANGSSATEASSGVIEEQSVDEARSNATQWAVSAESLGASLPSDELASEALSVGRADGGLLARIGARLFGRSLEPHADYNETAIEHLANEIDLSIGDPRVDYGIAVESGQAHVTEGHDGSMVDRSWLRARLDEAFFADPSEDRSFVAVVEYAPLRVDGEDAQAACDLVNGAIADGASFSYRGATWSADAATVGSWVATSVEPVGDQGDEWRLAVELDADLVKSYIVESAKEHAEEDPLIVSFESSESGLVVHIDSEGTIPQADEAASSLEASLFGGDGQGGSSASVDGDPVSVEIGEADAPSTMPFDDAVSLGVISPFSSFTTEYTTGVGTEARNHNIHLVSDLLDGSIVKANGGEWSFNDTAGECNEEKGFQAAGAIVAGEYTDSIGGGICQVATTVFNAVYDSGLPITLRFNHTLYISSYPAGRDAAVSWPDLDLKWRNYETSDVVLRMSYTDSTVTATLYGVDPEYTVTTEVGNWEEGEKHTTVYREDPSLAEGTSYVETAGTDGSSITVVRTVLDKNGTLVREDVFSSTYDPKDEVVVCAPGYRPQSEDDTG